MSDAAPKTLTEDDRACLRIVLKMLDGTEPVPGMTYLTISGERLAGPALIDALRAVRDE